MNEYVKQYERIEKKIEVVEYAVKQENTPYNRSLIHGAYQSCVKLAKTFEDPRLAKLAVDASEVIVSITLRANPNFKFRIKHK